MTGISTSDIAHSYSKGGVIKMCVFQGVGQETFEHMHNFMCNLRLKKNVSHFCLRNWGSHLISIFLPDICPDISTFS